MYKLKFEFCKVVTPNFSISFLLIRVKSDHHTDRYVRTYRSALLGQKHTDLLFYVLIST